MESKIGQNRILSEFYGEDMKNHVVKIIKFEKRYDGTFGVLGDFVTDYPYGDKFWHGSSESFFENTKEA